MFLQSLARATPPHVYSQHEVWQRIGESPRVQALALRSRSLLEKVLTGDSGIERRSFVLPDPLELFTLDAESLNRHFEEKAPLLAAASLEQALQRAEMTAGELDALFVCTCTGYLCPGLTSHLAERTGIRNDAFLQDVNGFGCGAALPMWRAAQGFLTVHPEAKVATVAVEVCSLAFFLNDEPGVLISAALFGDASASAIWAGAKNGREGQWRAEHFGTRHWPKEREKIRFVNQGGFLKNQLHRSVPSLAGQAVGELWAGRRDEPDAVLSHSGGREVVVAVEDATGRSVPETRRVMADFGNCSSPSVMMALDERLRDRRAESDTRYWLTAFGAGFAAHSCELVRS